MSETLNSEQSKSSDQNSSWDQVKTVPFQSELAEKNVDKLSVAKARRIGQKIMSVITRSGEHKKTSNLILGEQREAKVSDGNYSNLDQVVENMTSFANDSKAESFSRAEPPKKYDSVDSMISDFRQDVAKADNIDIATDSNIPN